MVCEARLWIITVHGDIVCIVFNICCILVSYLFSLLVKWRRPRWCLIFGVGPFGSYSVYGWTVMIKWVLAGLSFSFLPLLVVSPSIYGECDDSIYTKQGCSNSSFIYYLLGGSPPHYIISFHLFIIFLYLQFEANHEQPERNFICEEFWWLSKSLQPWQVCI